MKFTIFLQTYDTTYNSTTSPEMDLQISHDEIKKAIQSLKSNKKVQVGKDQEKAQSERDSHSKNRGGKKPN